MTLQVWTTLGVGDKLLGIFGVLTLLSAWMFIYSLAVGGYVVLWFLAFAVALVGTLVVLHKYHSRTSA